MPVCKACFDKEQQGEAVSVLQDSVNTSEPSYTTRVGSRAALMQQQRAESAERHCGAPRVLPWQACARCLPCPTAHLENRSPVRAQGCTRVQQQSTQDPSWCWLLGSSNRKPGFSSWEKRSAPDSRMQVTADTQFPTHVLFLSPNQWFCVNIYFFLSDFSYLDFSYFFFFAAEKYRCSTKLILKFCVRNPERFPVLFEEDYPCPHSPLQGQQQKLLPSGCLHCSAKSNRQVPCWQNSIKTNGFSSLEIIALKLFSGISQEKEHRLTLKRN